MPAFYFSVVDNDGVIGADEAFEFPDLTAAVEQAKTVLGEMALDGLPSAPTNMIEIEVQDSARMPVARMTLELRIQYLR
ncbi:DUF6894 family protein [Rhizobium sp. CC-YZS058]|uniref:DUF6894 family protein n=1 Tax=Rhizobium sp. CC-YZS058 TaxID=3042153 RepID=UPI002B05E3A1|nr:hypothetical protein [Rhizobium sp. CC-YZS058]MEA3534588.1 hypothetical protein [Rhizobium sp. CC-YZS058]